MTLNGNPVPGDPEVRPRAVECPTCKALGELVPECITCQGFGFTWSDGVKACYCPRSLMIFEADGDVLYSTNRITGVKERVATGPARFMRMIWQSLQVTNKVQPAGACGRVGPYCPGCGRPREECKP